MKADDIIRAWKAEDAEDDEQKEQTEVNPANPAGEQELSDEDLESIGGATRLDACGIASCDVGNE